MRLAPGLAIPEDLLRIASVQVHHALGCEDSGKADQECDQANVSPAETHGTTRAIEAVWSKCHQRGWAVMKTEQYLYQIVLRCEFEEANFLSLLRHWNYDAGANSRARLSGP